MAYLPIRPPNSRFYLQGTKISDPTYPIDERTKTISKMYEKKCDTKQIFNRINGHRNISTFFFSRLVCLKRNERKKTYYQNIKLDFRSISLCIQVLMIHLRTVRIVCAIMKIEWTRIVHFVDFSSLIFGFV